jgi:hypothetical protein
MREQVLAQVRSLAPTGYKISKELPYDESGTALYLKNPKTIYVDATNIDNDTFLSTLDGSNFSNQITSVRLYFTIDAKNIPADYDTLVTNLRAIKESLNISGAINRESFVSTDYQGDVLISELEYRLTRLN